MKITSLVDNVSHGECGCEHGLSLYVELDSGKRILFDTGRTDMFARNAERLGIDLSLADIAVLSHGHDDHGGGLPAFLKINDKAEVYLRESAFDDHYSIRSGSPSLINIDPSIKSSQRLVFTSPVERIDDSVVLFSDVSGDFPLPAGSEFLRTASGPDDFRHEQSMVVREGDKVVLFGGCGHAGIVNIILRAEQVTGLGITHVLSGMHLALGKQTEEYMEALASSLLETKASFITMHCTGTEPFMKLKDRMGDRIRYLSCGETVSI